MDLSRWTRRKAAAGLLAAAVLAALPVAVRADEVEGDGDFPVEDPRAREPMHPDLPLLWSWGDETLQSDLERAMARIDLADPLRRGRLSVALVDITDRLQPRVAAINGDRMFYAASLPKIGVMLAVFEKAEADLLEIDEPTREQIYRMIRFSSNADSTALMRRVGKRYIAEVLSSPVYRLYDEERGGGIWAGKDYGKGGLWKRDPIRNLSHGATVMQVARFYYLLEMGRLVSPAASLEMKQILERRGSGKKFMDGLRRVQPDARILRKGGTWRSHHADGALVERSDGAAYIVAALADDVNAVEWMIRIAVAADGLIPGPAARTATSATP